MAKNLVKSKTLPNIALPKNSYIKADTYSSRNTANLLSRCHIFAYGCSLARKRKEFASFVTYTKLSDLCQRTLKAYRQRITVPATHPHLPYSSRSTSATSPSAMKNSANLFAEFETLRTFASARILKSVSDAVLYFIAKSRSAVSVSIQCSCQRKKGLRFFRVHTLTNFCFELWQEQTKVPTRSRVRSLHLLSLPATSTSRSTSAACCARTTPTNRTRTRSRSWASSIKRNTTTRASTRSATRSWPSAAHSWSSGWLTPPSTSRQSSSENESQKQRRSNSYGNIQIQQKRHADDYDSGRHEAHLCDGIACRSVVSKFQYRSIPGIMP